MRSSECPVCGGLEVKTIFMWERVPVFCNVLHETREQALRAERAAMRLVVCHRCGFIHNAAFEPQKAQYGPHYGNPLSASPHFRKYATRIAEELIRKYDLYGKEIIEIGCGDGYFLRLLCDIGRNRGIGFDPSCDPRSASADQEVSGVRIVADTYSRQHEQHHPALVCCRHVLEHIHDPLGFLKGLRRTLDGRNECIVFFEVPDARHTFLRGAIWDILYEHCNYFARESLEWVFEAAGFEVLQTCERYEGQFLTIEGRPACVAKSHGEKAGESGDMRSPCAEFQDLFQRTVDSWRMRFADWHERRRQIVAWGAGTKGIMFLNVLGLSYDTLGCVVDIHPRKQGKFIPGTGQEIIGPPSLTRHRPDTIIVMNPLYLREIQGIAVRYLADVTFVSASDAACPAPAACGTG
ncbi:MAG TPA: class I SAM-dependent methyltransferase [Sedimentisphaerales bacterium]|nr:class I SAM-dependent methyltransferase [Sedimentisphaerales bacterium]HRS12889.1 class I SAM-dependent methyltransferase [Sedimentisphaerales bacterium]HRV49509.1 class I SAM-dependent methyltransferase [Sedimentisphaerales bacterium]